MPAVLCIRPERSTVQLRIHRLAYLLAATSLCLIPLPWWSVCLGLTGLCIMYRVDTCRMSPVVMAYLETGCGKWDMQLSSGRWTEARLLSSWRCQLGLVMAFELADGHRRLYWFLPADSLQPSVDSLLRAALIF